MRALHAAALRERELPSSGLVASLDPERKSQAKREGDDDHSAAKAAAHDLATGAAAAAIRGAQHEARCGGRVSLVRWGSSLPTFWIWTVMMQRCRLTTKQSKRNHIRLIILIGRLEATASADGGISS